MYARVQFRKCDNTDFWIFFHFDFLYKNSHVLEIFSLTQSANVFTNVRNFFQRVCFVQSINVNWDVLSQRQKKKKIINLQWNLCPNWMYIRLQRMWIFREKKTSEPAKMIVELGSLFLNLKKLESMKYFKMLHVQFIIFFAY